MVKRKHTVSGTIKGKGSSSKPLKKHEIAIEQTPLQIEAPLLLRVYNPNEVPPPQVEKPLQAAISIESNLSKSKTTPELVVEKVPTTSSKGKKTYDFKASSLMVT